MTIKEAAEKLNLSPQLLRVWAMNGCPFIEIIRNTSSRNTYYVSESRMRKWCEGEQINVEGR